MAEASTSFVSGSALPEGALASARTLAVPRARPVKRNLPSVSDFVVCSLEPKKLKVCDSSGFSAVKRRCTCAPATGLPSGPFTVPAIALPRRNWTRMPNCTPPSLSELNS